MWRDAVNEIRLHPARFSATLLAIAISVGFLAAISVFVGTEQVALGKSQTLNLSTSDIYLEPAESHGDLTSRIADVEGVAGVYPIGEPTMSPVTNGERSTYVTLNSVPPERFRWARAVEGRYPQAPGEVALSASVLDALGLNVGEQLRLERAGVSLAIVGKTDDPRSVFGGYGYLAGEPDALLVPSYGVRVDDDAEIDAVIAELRQEVDGARVERADTIRQDNLNELTGDFDVFKYMLQAFAGVALLVGSITIANTFTILATQRRRQTALLRAVGASTGDVLGRLVTEAALLGFVGSLAGVGLGIAVAALGSSYTGSLYWGLQVRPNEMAVAVLIGILTTVLAAVLPSLRATRVKPVEALHVVPSESRAKRIGIVRIALCVVLSGVGVVLVAMSRVAVEEALPWAMGGGVFLSLGILLGAPLFVPPLLRLAALVFGRRPTARLALLNAARNPMRASATATALMLAVGLIATLQVSIATVRTSGVAFINERYPVDIVIDYSAGVEESTAKAAEEIAGIERALPIETKEFEVDSFPLRVRDGQAPEQSLGLKPAHSDDTTIVLPDWAVISDHIEIGGHRLAVKRADGYSTVGMVSTAVFTDIDAEVSATQLWMKMTDRSSVSTLNQVVSFAERSGGSVEASGAIMASTLDRVLDVLLVVLTALLGVAVIVALVGVGNTLGLSVLERQRESALLRALGMQRGQLRLSLLIEAVALVGVGVVVGLAAGMFFGWLGASSALIMLEPEDRPDLLFSIDPWWTLGLIGVCLAASCLASVLPGRRAANATPTEALAAE